MVDDFCLMELFMPLFKVRSVLAAASLCIGLSSGSRADAVSPITHAEIDETVGRAMEIFSIPGAAVGIVKDGKVVFAKGYGVRELGKTAKVDPDTVFPIGSNTKAFTTTLLAMLVDEGKVHWDDKVIDYLADFRLYDPYVTREFTVRDLVTHRSGLGPGAGDLLFVPATDFSRDDIIRALRHLKPVSSFRSRFDYDNLLYMVAGQIIAAVTGTSWEDAVTNRILHPLRMEPCAASMERMTDRRNVAAPHSMVEGKLQTVTPADFSVIGPAGTIQCNISGMMKWVQTQLAGGQPPGGERLFSTAQRDEMWSPQTIMPNSSPLSAYTRTHFTSYGLGWGVEDFHGFKRVQHSGGVPGTVSYVNMIPELNLGVVVLTNQGDGGAMRAIALRILESYAGAPRRDWVSLLQSMSLERQQKARAVEAEVAAAAAGAKLPPTLPLQSYTGVFEDPWRGEARVRMENGELILQFSHTDSLEGVLTSSGGNLFIVRWHDRSLHADAYVRFSQDFGGKVDGFTMQATSPLTDFSFDFQDLDFHKRTD